MKKAKFTIQ